MATLTPIYYLKTVQFQRGRVNTKSYFQLDLNKTFIFPRALKESGYESDSTLVFRRREDTEAPLSPAERRAAYRDLQAGGEPPLRGFRSPAPPRQGQLSSSYYIL